MIAAHCGIVREVHLSHNRITHEGVERLFTEQVLQHYPMSRTGKAFPLFVRLEHNENLRGRKIRNVKPWVSSVSPCALPASLCPDVGRASALANNIWPLLYGRCTRQHESAVPHTASRLQTHHHCTSHLSTSPSPVLGQCERARQSQPNAGVRRLPRGGVARRGRSPGARGMVGSTSWSDRLGVSELTRKWMMTLRKTSGACGICWMCAVQKC